MRRRTLLRSAAVVATTGVVGSGAAGGNRGGRATTTEAQETTTEAGGTQAFALVMGDPDAPNPPFVHWLLWNVPADTREISKGVPDSETVEALDGAVQGANGTGDLGYVGPCPPEGDPQHTYLFSLYALEEPVDLDPGAVYDEVVTVRFSKALAQARYVGQYERG